MAETAGAGCPSVYPWDTAPSSHLSTPQGSPAYPSSSLLAWRLTPVQIHVFLYSHSSKSLGLDTVACINSFCLVVSSLCGFTHHNTSDWQRRSESLQHQSKGVEHSASMSSVNRWHQPGRFWKSINTICFKWIYTSTLSWRKVKKWEKSWNCKRCYKTAVHFTSDCIFKGRELEEGSSGTHSWPCKYKDLKSSLRTKVKKTKGMWVYVCNPTAGRQRQTYPRSSPGSWWMPQKKKKKKWIAPKNM